MHKACPVCNRAKTKGSSCWLVKSAVTAVCLCLGRTASLVYHHTALCGLSTKYLVINLSVLIWTSYLRDLWQHWEGRQSLASHSASPIPVISANLRREKIDAVLNSPTVVRDIPALLFICLLRGIIGTAIIHWYKHIYCDLQITH